MLYGYKYGHLCKFVNYKLKYKSFDTYYIVQHYWWRTNHKIWNQSFIQCDEG